MRFLKTVASFEGKPVHRLCRHVVDEAVAAVRD
jgi:hypothetical protein